MPIVQISATQRVQYSRQLEVTDSEMRDLMRIAENDNPQLELGDIRLDAMRDMIDAEPVDPDDINICVKVNGKWKDAWAKADG